MEEVANEVLLQCVQEPGVSGELQERTAAKARRKTYGKNTENGRKAMMAV